MLGLSVDAAMSCLAVRCWVFQCMSPCFAYSEKAIGKLSLAWLAILVVEVIFCIA